jgi:ribulose-5-phosphate 4-epimerase/fuculose-1-phosphate aldolase
MLAPFAALGDNGPADTSTELIYEVTAAMSETRPAVMPRLPAAADDAEKRRVLELADTPEARRLKVKLAAGYRILARCGMNQGVAGHISLRIPGAPDYFWVNPFGLPFGEVTADSFAVVSHQGELVGGWPLVNYAAFCIHAAIHRARPDVHCAAHTHSPAGSAFSALNCLLEPFDQVCCSFYEDHSVYSEYDGVVLDMGQTDGIVKALGNKRALILAHHGVITCAGTVEQAVIDMIDLDRSCDLNLRVLATGRKIPQIPPEAARQARQVQTTPMRWGFQWPGMVMELSRHERDYDPQGWVPAEEAPTVERVRHGAARARAAR